MTRCALVSLGASQDGHGAVSPCQQLYSTSRTIANETVPQRRQNSRSLMASTMHGGRHDNHLNRGEYSGRR